MKIIGVTQKVIVDTSTHERLDCLDQRWSQLLTVCGLTLLPLPNDTKQSQKLIMETPLGGILFTGGNNLTNCGGDAPERDKVEKMLFNYATRNNLPLMGICRGMQFIQQQYGATLQTIDGHVRTTHQISIGGKNEKINSYHRWGTTEPTTGLAVMARAEDGIIEAVRHVTRPIIGVMWHPERYHPFLERDVKLITESFTNTRK